MATPAAPLDLDATRAAAQALYAERMATVDAAVRATNVVRETQTALVEAERHAARAYAEAERSGWTSEDLRRLGLEAPDRRSPGRPRRSRSRSTSGPAKTIQPDDTAPPADQA